MVALHPTTLRIRRGEFVAIIGPSGSGKSTLLGLMGGLVAPTAGRIWVGDLDLSALDLARTAELRRRSVGYVFQELNLIDGLSAVENVTLPLELDGMRFSTASELAMKALSRVGIDHLSDRRPDQMSGGERQRTAIARAMVGDRSILLTDEPTGSLDTATGENVVDLLVEFCRFGGCCVMVTHDLSLARRADRTLRLSDGQLQEANSGSRQGNDS